MSSGPLRLMQVLHQGGGAGSVGSVLHLSLGLARRGHVVYFACPPESEVETLARAAGTLEVLPLELRRSGRFANAKALSALLASVPVDLINSHSARDREALTWLGLTRRLALPVVFTRRQMPRTLWLENRLASRVAARVIAVSTPVAEALIRRGMSQAKVVVIPNGLITESVDREVSAQELARWRGRIGWEPSRRTLGMVARLKDQRVLLEALRLVRTPVRLVFAGVDPREVKALAEPLPERHAVVSLPFEPGVRPLYQQFELVLLASRMEGLSQALLEAMALDKPVIASAAGGNLDLITDGIDGMLVPPLDPRAWAEAIEALLGDPARAERLGTEARHTARERFALEHTIDRTEALYREVVDGFKRH